MKKIVILNDRLPNINDQINLGDRALTLGFYNLIQAHFDAEIFSGGWKNFPYFNIKKFDSGAKEKDIEKIFTGWMAVVDQASRQSALRQAKMISQFERSFLANNSISISLDNKVKRKNTRGLWAPLMPYFFVHTMHINSKKKSVMQILFSIILQDLFQTIFSILCL